MVAVAVTVATPMVAVMVPAPTAVVGTAIPQAGAELPVSPDRYKTIAKARRMAGLQRFWPFGEGFSVLCDLLGRRCAKDVENPRKLPNLQGILRLAAGPRLRLD